MIILNLMQGFLGTANGIDLVEENIFRVLILSDELSEISTLIKYYNICLSSISLLFLLYYYLSMRYALKTFANHSKTFANSLKNNANRPKAAANPFQTIANPWRPVQILRKPMQLL